MTPRQVDLLNFLKVQSRKTSITPSYQEMADAIGLKSKHGVHRLVCALEERGKIRRIPGRARCIQIMGDDNFLLSVLNKTKNAMLRLPEDACGFEAIPYIGAGKPVRNALIEDITKAIREVSGDAA